MALPQGNERDAHPGGGGPTWGSSRQHLLCPSCGAKGNGGGCVWESRVGVEAALISVRLHSVSWHPPTSCHCIFGHDVGPHMLLFTSYVFFNSVHFLKNLNNCVCKSPQKKLESQFHLPSQKGECKANTMNYNCNRF